MNSYQRLLTLLGDGELHSGAALAESLGVSRTAVWKQLERLRELGLGIDADAGQGYQLRSAYEALDQEKIIAAMSPLAQKQLDVIDVFWECDSTNSYLLNSDASPGARVCLADYQADGRGRRGRRWMSPPGSGIWLSVGWTWDVPPAQLTALSLAIGAAITVVLQRAGVGNVRLKWPNDLQIDGRKLAGILIDVQGDSSGPLTVVAGLGLNTAVPSEVAEAVEADAGLSPVGLNEFASHLSRNDLAGKITSAMIEVLDSYAETGFEPYRNVWQDNDALLEQAVSVSGSQTLTGIARGIDGNGFLIVDAEGRRELVGAGDVTLRKEQSR